MRERSSYWKKSLIRKSPTKNRAEKKSPVAPRTHTEETGRTHTLPAFLQKDKLENNQSPIATQLYIKKRSKKSLLKMGAFTIVILAIVVEIVLRLIN